MLSLYDTGPFHLHREPSGHPERVERLRAVEDVYAGFASFPLVEPVPASPGDLAPVHPERHVSRVREACFGGLSLDPDTYTSEGTWDAALFAAGSAVDAVKRVFAGEASSAFVPARPPGHHAGPERAMGFCLFNNAAVAAAAALRGGASRVAVIDWDVHHGNGTQAVFYDDPRVFYMSVHQYPLYPGTGLPEEAGSGKGRGCTVNLPVPPAASPEEWMREFHRGMDVLASRRFDLVIVSCGFDAHEFDPLGSQGLRGEHYAGMTRSVVELAGVCGAAGVVSLLEGGYSLAGLKEGLGAHLAVLAAGG